MRRNKINKAVNGNFDLQPSFLKKKALKALKVAQKLERTQINQGRKWIRVNSRTQVLVNVSA